LTSKQFFSRPMNSSGCSPTDHTKYEQIAEGLYAFAKGQGFRGHDPFDGLSSRVFQATPLRRSRLARLALTQGLKRSPVDLRSLFAVPQLANPKGLALFLSGAVDLHRLNRTGRWIHRAEDLIERITRSRRSGYSGACWGYPFDWQARAFFLPRNTPTIVATSYAAWSLMDAWDAFRSEDCLHLARSACDFVMGDLGRTESEAGICFSYSPLDATQVHNASMLGARLLARVGSVTGEDDLIALAARAVAYCVHDQTSEGSWPYGSARYQTWVDNFHTGFILECLHDFGSYSGRTWPMPALEKGLAFYRDRLFLLDGTARYFHTRTYPLDVHAFAQGILTFTKLRNSDPGCLQFAGRIVRSAFQHLLGGNGLFHYQRHGSYVNRICYLRWSQAWMFRALAAYLLATSHSTTVRQTPH
jgi:hypothetical protein